MVICTKAVHEECPVCKHAGSLLSDYLLRCTLVFDEILLSQRSYSRDEGLGLRATG